MMHGHSHDKFDKEYLKYYLNSIYGSGLYSDCSIQDENVCLILRFRELLKERRSDIEREYNATVLKALAKQREEMESEYDAKLQEALAKQHEEMEREYKETYAMFEKRCKKYAEELAHAKADLAKANFILRNLYLLFEDMSIDKEEKHNECKTEVQEAKEEDRAARESKDTD